MALLAINDKKGADTEWLSVWMTTTLHHSIIVNVACDLQIIKRLDFREYGEIYIFFNMYILNIKKIVLNINDLN